MATKKPTTKKAPKIPAKTTGTVTRTFSLRLQVDEALRAENGTNFDPSLSATVNRLLARGLGLTAASRD